MERSNAISMADIGRLAASGSEGGQIKVWDPRTGIERGSIVDDSTWAVTAIAFSPDGKTLTTGDADGNVKHWDVPDGSVP
jgi:WD40 repeat protein